MFLLTWIYYAGTSECRCSFDISLFHKFVIASIKIFILSMLTLGVSITDKAGMDALPRFGTVEVVRVCASQVIGARYCTRLYS